jgi:chromosome segregation ATPase
MAVTSKTYGAKTGGLRRLLVAVEENAAALPDVAMERINLELALSSAEDAKNRQDSAVGNKQRATQELKEALARAEDAARQLQNAAKFKLGPRNEKLVVFQVTPLRKRGSRAAAQLKRQEGELQRQESDLARKEAELRRRRQGAEALKKQVELLRQELEPVEQAP